MKNILEMMEMSAKKYPDKCAFADEFEEISYITLLKNSKKIGAYVADKLDAGLKNKAVAVLLDKTVHAVSAFMGVLYSGNFYVVIDSEMPVDRVNMIFDTVAPAAVITDKAHEEKVQSLKFDNVVLCIEDAPELNQKGEDFLKTVRKKMIDTDPAYGLFTSGSTGVPKGAILTHKNVLAYTEWFTEAFDITSETVFGSQTPFYFSMSVSDMYSNIKMGGTFHIIPKKYFAFPIKLMEFLEERKVNTIYWVPSALCIVANWKMFQYKQLPELKKVLFAGEVMPTKQLNYWIENIPEAMYANLFGPTETTDICTYYVVNRRFSDDEAIPMGNACNNCDVFVLDENGNEITDKDVVLGEDGKGTSPEGELYARGSFLSYGYFGNPEKTAEAFVQNPMQSYYPEKVYKTGDLVKYNGYGELVYVSRKDFQIKHMGYRIELGEIEAAASSMENVRACVCIYDVDEDKIILVYEGKKIDEGTYMKHVAERVPHYMVPNTFIRIKNMPHNQNGKIDRKWLTANYKTI